MENALQQEDQAQTGAEGAADATQDNQERDYEAEAKEWGWVPKEQFNGDPEKWKPAEQFVKDGEDVLPIVRSQNKRLKDELDAKDKEFAARLEKMERMNAKTAERQKKQFEEQIAEIKAQQRAAVSDGDQEAFDALEKKRETLEKENAETASEGDPQATVDAWSARNQWFNDDFKLNREATEYSQFLAQKNPNITLEDNLKATEEYIKQQYPEKFGGTAKQPAANGLAAVDGGGAFNGLPNKKSAFDRLPAEARAQAEKDVAAGLYKTKEEWAKVYNS